MQSLNPTPKHLFRVFLSSLETKELELLKTWNFCKSLKVLWGANYRLSEVLLITEDSQSQAIYRWLEASQKELSRATWLSSKGSFPIRYYWNKKEKVPLRYWSQRGARIGLDGSAEGTRSSDELQLCGWLLLNCVPLRYLEFFIVWSVQCILYWVSMFYLIQLIYCLFIHFRWG